MCPFPHTVDRQPVSLGEHEHYGEWRQNMASVSDVTLQFGAASADPRLVTVKGKLHFDANEVGDSVRLSIALHLSLIHI